jgi:hypothetical protein
MTQSEFLIKDIKDNHWPRVAEGLDKGYIDENQILVIFDHAVRARILQALPDLDTAHTKYRKAHK